MTFDEKYQYGLKIPKERVAVLIGKGGEVKKEIEASTGVHLKIDSKEGDVFIRGEDALNLLAVREMVKAIGRGFNPEIAKLLLKPDYTLEIVQIEEFANTQNLNRVRGRVIGTGGKARRTIETLTNTYLRVYGKTISIIGNVEDVMAARRAVENLLSGSKHGNIYKWLEKRRKEINQKEMLGSEPADDSG